MESTGLAVAATPAMETLKAEVLFIFVKVSHKFLFSVFNSSGYMLVQLRKLLLWF
jgi:hypothetical protein